MQEQNVIPAVIAVDFDGTITSGDSFPKIGAVDPAAKKCINALADAGFCIIIFTCREGELALEAEQFLIAQGIRYMHLNKNCRVRVNHYGNDCSKIGANVYIDDRCVSFLGGKIDWEHVYEKVMKYYGSWAHLWKGRHCSSCEGSGKDYTQG